MPGSCSSSNSFVVSLTFLLLLLINRNLKALSLTCFHYDAAYRIKIDYLINLSVIQLIKLRTPTFHLV